MNFDKDYFERGLQTGKSMYENYRWIPELTIPLAYEIIQYLEITRDQSILDFGCAKGYLVKAFRLLHFDAWGTDISDYALGQAPLDVKGYLFDWKRYDQLKGKYDWIIAKDVFEHIDVKNLQLTLAVLGMLSRNIFAIIPLGENGKYNAGTNDLDPSHVICENHQWWCDFFNDVGFKVRDLNSNIPYMKMTYKDIPNAHGFFKLKAR